MKNTYFISLKNSFKDWLSNDRLISLGNSFELPALFRRFGWRLLSSSGLRLGNSTKRLTHLKVFGYLLLRMRKHHGDSYVVKYLKACQLAVQKSIAGTPFISLREIEPDLPLRRLTRSGLPWVIPREDRRAIIAGHPSVIRWWLTLFSVYRVINLTGSLKLNTITDPGMTDLELSAVSREVVSLLKHFSTKWPKPKLVVKDLLWLETSSPTHSTSWAGMLVNAKALKDQGLWKIIEKWGINWNEDTAFHKMVLAVGRMSERKIKRDVVMTKDGPKPVNIAGLIKDHVGEDWLGRLAEKVEAAGKIRVFALVDVWTQSVLKPVHEFLFSILKTLPNDGTFDQHASVLRCMEKVRKSGCSFGYDLSAATDRLPMSLQVSLLGALIGEERADEWRTLLVGRSYYLPALNVKGKWAIICKRELQALKYACGQPMGALSSWASLAITHHLLVQVSHRRAYGFSVNPQWFDNYELLGDDIIIFDGKVAKEYLSLMEEIGVPINVSKSVISNRLVTEFAKVTTLNGVDVSALSWKLFLSQNNLQGRVSTALWVLKKDFSKKPLALYKAITRLTPTKEGDYFSSLVMAILTIYKSKGIKYKELLESLQSSKFYYMNPREVIFKGRNLDMMEKLFLKFYFHSKFRTRFPRLDPFLMRNIERLMVESLEKKLRIIKHSEVFGLLMAEKVMRELGVPFDPMDHSLVRLRIALTENVLSKYVHKKGTLYEQSIIEKIREEVQDFRENGSQFWNFGTGLDHLLSRVELLDGIISFQSICERARAKGDNNVSKPKKKSSGFKPLEWLRKV